MYRQLIAQETGATTCSSGNGDEEDYKDGWERRLGKENRGLKREHRHGNERLLGT